MGYKFRDIRGTSSGTTPLGPLRAGRPMKRDRVMSSFADADRTLGNGSRVLGRVGLHGEAAQQIVSTTTSSGAVQVYPLKTASRVAMRGKYLLTPGHFVRVSVLALPSGATQKLSGGSYVLDAVVGWIDVTAQFSGGASDTVTHTFSLPASDLQYLSLIHI